MVQHPKVKAAFEAAGVELVPDANTNAYELFLKKVGKNPITKHVDAVYRLYDNKQKKEFVFYNATWRARDRNRNMRDAHLPGIGKYQLPEFERRYNSDADEYESTDTVTQLTTVYEIPFSDDVLGKLDGVVDDETLLYVIATTGIKYGGFSRRDWETRPFEELVDIARLGPPKSRTRKVMESKAGRGEVR